MKKPWYKQFWPWFLIALPVTSVTYSLTAVYIFSQNQVSLVAEDYYKKGKGINIDLSKLKIADDKKVQAMFWVKDDEILVSLNKGDLSQYPTLNVMFQHRTLADKDIKQMVNADGSGNYRIALNQPLTGPWYVEIEPFGGEWMLNGRAALPSKDSFKLYGQNKE